MSSAIPERVARLIQGVKAWAAAQEQVAGVALVGSYARQAAKPESDVDLVIVSDRPERLLSNTDWVRALGAPLRVEREEWGRVISVRVWYADGLEAEFGIADRHWAAAPLDAGAQRVVANGCILLFDRGRAFEGIG